MALAAIYLAGVIGLQHRGVSAAVAAAAMVAGLALPLYLVLAWCRPPRRSRGHPYMLVRFIPAVLAIGLIAYGAVGFESWYWVEFGWGGPAQPAAVPAVTALLVLGAVVPGIEVLLRRPAPDASSSSTLDRLDRSVRRTPATIRRHAPSLVVITGITAAALAILAATTLVLVSRRPAWEPQNQGYLRAQTVPALAAQITIDGAPASRWSLEWVMVDAGDHQICFSDMAGWSGPGCRDVTVRLGETTEILGEYRPQGYLRVTTSPPTDATVSVDGIPRNDWGLFTQVPPGNHQVCFGKKEDMSPPPCQSISVVASEVTSVEGNYRFNDGEPGPDPSTFGLLRVYSTPAVPTQVAVDGQWRQTWSLDWLKIDPGPHTVCFTDVAGFDTPPCERAVVRAGRTTELEGWFGP